MLSCLSILLLGLLLAFPSLTVEGASAGLLLWSNVVLPTLAPFMICTRMLSAVGAEKRLISPFYPFIHRMFGFSKTGTYVFFCGLLCGYPLGAKLCAEKQKSGEISLAEAQCLLAVSNHPSPMFLLGFVNRQLDLPVSFCWLIPLCLYVPILFLAPSAGILYGLKAASRQVQPFHLSPLQNGTNPSVDEAIFSTAHTMVLIGGWIMLFSIFARWIQTIPGLSPSTKAVLGGLAEITTGIPLICRAFSDNRRLCLLLVLFCVAFGGGSGIFQTRSVLLANDCRSADTFADDLKNPQTADRSPKTVVTGHRDTRQYAKQKNAGLSIRHYILWKAVHALLAAGTLIFLLWLLPEPEPEQMLLPVSAALPERLHWIHRLKARCGLP